MESPLKKQKTKKVDKVELLAKFKSRKPVVSKASAKALVDEAVDLVKMLWIEDWLIQLVRENSYPPQVAGRDAFAALSQFLSPTDCLNVLERIRRDYRVRFPQMDLEEKEELEWLIF